MDNFLSVIITELTPQALFAFVGGLLGGSFAMLMDAKYARTVKIILVILSGCAGSALGDYLHVVRHIHSLGALCFAGSVVGVPIGFALEGIRLFFPTWFDKLLTKLGDKAINKID